MHACADHRQLPCLCRCHSPDTLMRTVTELASRAPHRRLLHHLGRQHAADAPQRRLTCTVWFAFCSC